MILLVAEHAIDYYRMEEFLTYRNMESVTPNPHSVTRLLKRVRRNVDAIVYDYSSEKSRRNLEAICALFEERPPIVLVFNIIQPDEMIQLVERGFRNFRYQQDFLRPELDAYLYDLIKQNQNQNLIHSVKGFMNKIDGHELIKTNSLLDSLEFGAILLSAPNNSGDCFVLNVNAQMEEILQVDLKPYENMELGDLLASQALPESAKNVIGSPDLTGVEEREAQIINYNDDVYLERFLAPLYNRRGEKLGYLLALRDVSFEVEAGILDHQTGLLQGKNLERDLAIKINRLEKQGDDSCRFLSVLRLELSALSGMRDTSSGFLPLLRHTGAVLKRMTTDLGSVSRSGRSTFLIYMPTCQSRRIATVARKIRRRLMEGAPVSGEVHMGLVLGKYKGNYTEDRESYLLGLKQELSLLTRESEIALRRAQESDESRIVQYTRTAGYVEI